VDHHAGGAVDAASKKRLEARAAGEPAAVSRYVCTACGGVYWNPVNDRCPGCHGVMEVKQVMYDANGVPHVQTD